MVMGSGAWRALKVVHALIGPVWLKLSNHAGSGRIGWLQPCTTFGAWLSNPCVHLTLLAQALQTATARVLSGFPTASRLFPPYPGLSQTIRLVTAGRRRRPRRGWSNRHKRLRNPSLSQVRKARPDLAPKGPEKGREPSQTTKGIANHSYYHHHPPVTPPGMPHVRLSLQWNYRSPDTRRGGVRLRYPETVARSAGGRDELWQMSGSCRRRAT